MCLQCPEACNPGHCRHKTAQGREVVLTRYILSRLVAMCITSFIILTIAFMVARLMPGSVYDNPEYSIEIIQALEAKAQLDKPWIIQYFHFLKGALRGDWGVSVKIAPCVPVFDVIKQRIPITILLNIISL